MRMIMACAALVALVVASAEAQDGAAPAKDAITDAAIINSCGGRLAKMFAQFGTPSDLWVARGNTEDEDEVICNYHTYMFRVRGKVIQTCFFAGLERADPRNQDRRQPRRRRESPGQSVNDLQGQGWRCYFLWL